ncbi:MAG: non-ribosomal peptide synthase, partial [Synechococcales cyanobacterium M58_A2018_015]|nr:non-ribosomal peptide synthase [Synechococcales cyanobacterium M58_A2018_015]
MNTKAINAKAIVDIYPLSPLQQGMLFHSLLAPASGAYIVQVCFTLQGCLNQVAFAQAWQQALQRHPVLRTALVWEKLDQPLQVVGRQVTLPIEELDWQSVPVDVQQSRLATLLQGQRRQGFVLTRAPLMRLTVIQLQPAVHQVIWCYHHALLDGWSVPLLLQEVLTDYDCFAQGLDSPLTPPRPYRDYIAWLQQQDQSAAESFWQRMLAGFHTPTPLGIDRSAPLNPQPSYQEQSLVLSTELTAQLRTFTQRQQLTLNTLIQAAYALLLSRYSGEPDVVFGITSSGRPAELLGSETMIGLFINTLPLRVKVPPQEDLITWLQQLQFQQMELRQYEYSSLIEIQGWSEVPRNSQLFESLFIFENYPISPQFKQSLADLQVQSIQTTEQTNYPLTVYAVADATITLRILYDCDRFSSDAISRMLGHLQTVLAGMAAQQAKTQPVQLSDVPLLTDFEREQQVGWNSTEM